MSHHYVFLGLDCALHVILPCSARNAHGPKSPNVVDGVGAVRRGLHRRLAQLRALSHVVGELLHGLPSAGVPHVDLFRIAAPGPLRGRPADRVVGAPPLRHVHLLLRVEVLGDVEPCPLEEGVRLVRP
eukprot:scaffold50993_cov61-Phaeocystis_antarctica.AAC.2